MKTLIAALCLVALCFVMFPAPASASKTVIHNYNSGPPAVSTYSVAPVYSATRVYAAPRAYSSVRVYSAPRSYSAVRVYSAPRRVYVPSSAGYSVPAPASAPVPTDAPLPGPAAFNDCPNCVVEAPMTYSYAEPAVVVASSKTKHKYKDGRHKTKVTTTVR